MHDVGEPTGFAGGRPSDSRAFLHKKLLGVVGKVSSILPIPGAGIIGTVARQLAGGGKKQPTRQIAPTAFTSRPTVAGAAGKEMGRGLKFGGNGNGTPDCTWPTRWDPRTGSCRIFVGERSGPDDVGQPVGDAVMGRYGAGLQPGVMTIDRAVCPRGTQLGDDGLCYNKSQISNKQRMWPRGRRPLLTGGEMRAIGIASRAGGKMDRTTKRLRELGMMKQLPKARAAKSTHHHHPASK